MGQFLIDNISTPLLKLKFSAYRNGISIDFLIFFAASFWTHGLTGQLPTIWTLNFGFAPRHFATADFLRLITSVVLTHDIVHLVLACTMIVLIVGRSELMIGTLNTFLTFSASHLFSILAFAIGISLLHEWHLGQTVSTLYSFHDVGPSAGYYGCLGRILLASVFRYKKLIVVGVVVVLLSRSFISFSQMPQSQASLSADIVHILALLLGMIVHIVAPIFKR